MKNDTLSVLNYFNYFKYPPHADELFLFLPKKISLSKFAIELSKLEKAKIIVKNNCRYTLGGYSKIFNIWSGRRTISIDRIKKIKWFIKILAKVAQIKLIGLTGGLSMLNSEKIDDIDIFIISVKNRMWTARFAVLILASCFGLRRGFKSKNINDKLCFNLFFDESALVVPDFKKNKYIAHEIVQMKPVVIKNSSYEQFLKKNNWVNSYFPNVNIAKYTQNNNDFLMQPIQQSKFKKTLLGDIFENFIKQIQMMFISRHKTNEIITKGQLWFFPQDFQNKIKKYI